jgi:hypothetical protein
MVDAALEKESYGEYEGSISHCGAHVNAFLAEFGGSGRIRICPVVTELPCL